MKAIQNIIGGITGAVALNILHQSAKKIIKDAPAVDLVGEQCITKGMRAMGLTPPKGNNLFLTTLAADLVSNAAYYSFIGVGKKKHLLLRGALYGLSAGVGALTLTEPIGLNDKPITKTAATQLMTVAWYLVGGLVTACTIKALLKNKEDIPKGIEV